jgi:hypothetical protein
MPRLQRAAVSREAGPALRPSLRSFPATHREWAKLGLWARGRAWLVRLSRRATLADYRARHRPLAGPAPGARLPQ